MEINAQSIAKAISEGKISYYEALNTYKGIREEEINAELRKLGGDPGAPVDGFEGKNSPKEEKVLYLTKDDTYYQNERIKYNNEAVQAKADMQKALANGNYLDAAFSFGKGMLAAYRKETTPENMSEAMRQDAGFGTVVKYAAALGAAVVTFTSCVEYNIGQNMEVYYPVKPNDSEFEKSVKEILNNIVKSLNENNEINQDTKFYIKKIFEILDEQNKSIEDLKEIISDNYSILTFIANSLIENNASLEEIKQLIGDDQILLTMVLESITEGNKLLADIKENMNTNQEEILETLVAIKNSVNTIEELIKNHPDYSQQLEDIKNAISEGDETTGNIMNMLESLLRAIQENGDTQVNILATLKEIQNSNKSDGEKLAAMLELLKNIDSTTQDISKKLDEIKDKLDSLSGAGGISKEDINAIIDAIKENGEKIDATNQLLAKMQDQDEKFQAQVLKLLANVGADYTDVLNKILDAVNNGNAKLEDITKLLAKMQNQDLEFQKNVLNAINDLGTNIAVVLNNILTNIGNDSTKLDQITQLLAKIDSNIQKYGEDGKTLGNNILNAINKLGSDVSNISTKLTQILNVVNTDKDTGKNIEALLNKVLEKMDTNNATTNATMQKIIDAIANIKIEGGGSGNVDFSSVEEMLKELVELTKNNNNTLTDINGKLDVIKVTQQAILDKINVEAHRNDERYTKLENFMNEVLKNLSSASGYDDSKLMEILSKLSNMIDTRLEELLNAIKNHEVHVTVDDITVTCKCECECGKPHEGILDDLEDALG